MRLSLSIPTSLLIFLLPSQTLASPAPAPIPGTQATQNGPITIPALSLGGAILAFGGATRVYYQQTDSSIHELVGNGSPNANRVYNDQIVIPAGKVRIGSPIVAVDYGNLAIVRASRSFFASFLSLSLSCPSYSPHSILSSLRLSPSICFSF